MSRRRLASATSIASAAYAERSSSLAVVREPPHPQRGGRPGRPRSPAGTAGSAPKSRPQARAGRGARRRRLFIDAGEESGERCIEFFLLQDPCPLRRGGRKELCPARRRSLVLPGCRCDWGLVFGIKCWREFAPQPSSSPVEPGSGGLRRNTQNPADLARAQPLPGLRAGGSPGRARAVPTSPAGRRPGAGAHLRIGRH